MNNAHWFYTDSRQTWGPVTEDRIIDMVEAGELAAGYFVMTEGAQEWQAVDESPFAGYMPRAMGQPVVAAAAAAAPSKPKAPPMRPVGQPYRKPVQPVPAPAARGAGFWAAVIGGGVAVALLVWLIRPGVPAERKTVQRIEGETMKILKVTGGEVEPQQMADNHNAVWSRGLHLWWRGGSKGYILKLQFHVDKAEAGKQRVKAVLTAAPDYGIVGVTLDGRAVRGAPFDMQAESVTPAGTLDWGLWNLKEGVHVVEFTMVGTHGADVAENGVYGFGLDYIQLEPPTAAAGPGAAAAVKAASAPMSPAVEQQKARAPEVAAAPVMAPPPPVARAPSPAPSLLSPRMERHNALRIPAMQLTDANLNDAVNFLRVQTAKLVPAGESVLIVIDSGVDAKAGRLNLDGRDLPLGEALRAVAARTRCELRIVGDAFHLQPR